MSKDKAVTATAKQTKTEIIPREAPSERAALEYRDVMQSVVNAAQFEILRGKTPEYATLTRPDNGYKYVSHGYVRDQLNRAFGFDYDFRVLPCFNGKPYDLQVQTVKGSPVDNLVVLGELTVRIRNPKNVTEILTTIVKSDFGSQVWRSKMELGDALKAASSDAFKRCALGLGVANDLYWNDDEKFAQFEETQRLQVVQAQQVIDRVPQTLVELISFSQSKYGFDAQQLAVKLEVANIVMVKDFAAAWAKLGASSNGNSH